VWAGIDCLREKMMRQIEKPPEQLCLISIPKGKCGQKREKAR
jgi:hypothetical protein